MAKFTKYNNPSKKHHRRKTYNPAAWDGAGTRDRYIETLIRLEAQKLAAEEKEAAETGEKETRTP